MGTRHWEMRKADQEITSPEELRAILAGARYVTMAMSLEDEPYLVTVSHGYDEERNVLYFHCAPEGRKMDILRENPRVWGEAIRDGGVEPAECEQRYATTQFRGRVSFPEDPGEKRHAIEVLISQFGGDVDAFFAKEGSEDRVRRVTIGRVDIETMTGKRSSG